MWFSIKALRNGAFLLFLVLLFAACGQPGGHNPGQQQQADKSDLHAGIISVEDFFDTLESCVGYEDVNKDRCWVCHLEDAIGKAHEVMSNPNASQEEIDAVLRDLEDAYTNAWEINEDQKTDPADPTEPESKDPADPIDPVDPIDPTEPEPKDPADPIDPVDPIEPTEPEPQEPEVNRNGLKQAINSAKTKIADVVPTSNGSNLLNTQRWASEEMLDAFSAAITAAENVYNNDDATQEETDAAATDLENAATAFIPQHGLLISSGINYSYNFNLPRDEDIVLTTEHTLSWRDNNSLTLTVAGFDSFQWYVNGKIMDGETGESITLYGRDFSITTHTVTLRVVKDGIPYTKAITFAVK